LVETAPKPETAGLLFYQNFEEIPAKRLLPAKLIKLKLTKYPQIYVSPLLSNPK
jgi:hypothetical protein